MPSTTLIRFNNNPVRVCDRCVHGQNQVLHERRRLEDIERTRARQFQAVSIQRDQVEKRLRALELKHFGPRPERFTLRRSRSLDDPFHCPPHDLIEASSRATALVRQYIPGAEEECAICLDAMEVGDAIYTTSCSHSFHYRCVRAIQTSAASNHRQCPTCRTTMEEFPSKRQCEHPRVRIGHRYCRDCGQSVEGLDSKPRGTESNAPTSFQAGTHGALVRCPQCHIQMRVLPHMYNMYVMHFHV